MFKKNVVLMCPDCDTVVEGSTGLFRKTFSCPNCQRTIDPRFDAMKVVTCNHCGNNVMFDTKRGSVKLCPSCHQSLAEYNVSTREVPCPDCNSILQIRYDEKMHTCAVCGTVFDAEQARMKKEAEANSKAMVIHIPESAKDHIICKHPSTEFPYASQVVVPEGYTALILYNGRCKAPYAPGNYPLSETILDQQEKLKTMNLDEIISVQIFFVKKLIGSPVFWGGTPEAYDADANSIGKISEAGSVTLAIDDAKAFAEFVGYKELKISDLFPANGGGEYTGFLSEIAHYCDKSTCAVLMQHAAEDFNFNYKALPVRKNIFEDEIRELVNVKFQERGIKATHLELTLLQFNESGDVSKKREKEEKIEANKEEIRVIIENPYDWSSLGVNVHKKDNLSLSTELVFGGSIKLRIFDDQRFFDRNEVRAWSQSNEISHASISEYVKNLVKNAADNVITGVLQAMINAEDLEIRDLAPSLGNISKNVKIKLVEFFAAYGLDIEQFSLRELDRNDSLALKKLSDSETHQVTANIDMADYRFDQRKKVEKAAVDSETAVNVDSISLDTETAILQNDKKRAHNEIDAYQTDAMVAEAKERIDFEAERRRRQYSHESFSEEEQWIHDQKMKTYGYQEDYAEAEHRAKMRDMTYDMEKSSALHYKNQQEIEARAAELRAQWEHQRGMEADILSHQIELAEKEWEAKRKNVLSQSGLSNDLEISAAEKDRIINSILRKIAESDLELTEKKDMYHRMLGNLQAGDALSQFKEATETKIDLDYKAGHMGIVLTKEEQDYLDTVLDRDVARKEGIKNADFIRAMQQQQVDTEYEMELLKLQYERDDYKDRLQHELDLKDREILILKMQLEAVGHAGDQDVTKLGIQSAVEVERARESAGVAKADIARMEAENKYRMMHEASERQMEEKREQERLKREDDYSKRADDLLSKMMSIKAAMEALSLANEKTAIIEGAGVKKAQAASASQIQTEQIKALLEEIKKIAEKKNQKSDKEKAEKKADKVDDFTVKKSKRVCPHCGAELASAYTTYCTSCHSLF